MEVFEAIEKRHSARRFADHRVEPEKLRRLFEAARLAPSAKNLQEWRFVVVQDKETRLRLAEAAFQRFVGDAPVILVCCAESDGYVMRCGLPSYPIDVAIAIDHISLAAVALDLGTCWIGKFDPDRVREILGIPERIHIVELLLVGYPADQPRPKNRLAVEEFVKFDHW